MIRFLCPSCRAKVQAPEDRVGQAALCPRCHRLFNVPQTSTPGLETPPPPAPSFPSQTVTPAPPAPPVPDEPVLPAAPVAPVASVEAELVEAPLIAAPMKPLGASA